MKRLFKNQWFWLGLIVLIGAILRFWNITSWQHLTYDQSRDYIILKRILIDHKLTLVGPTVSIAPGFFLPPFYYYSLLPFIYLFNFHIVGPDVYTAILGVLSIIVFYFLSRDFFGIFPSLVATFAYAVNSYLTQTSRHAWNPNTIFLYSILFFLSFEKYILKKQRKWFVLTGFSLGWAIGLHLTAVVFLPLFAYLLFLEIKNRLFNSWTVGGILLFLVIFFPLAVFDIKHNFPITKAGVAYINGSGSKSSGERSFLIRLKEMAVDSYKMPAVLLSGTFQKENMTVRPSNITAFSLVNIFSKINSAKAILIWLSLFLWSCSLLSVLFTKSKTSKMLIAFLMFGLLIRLCFPSSLFYFYYYLLLFPVIFLFLANLVNCKQCKITFSVLIIVLSSASWFINGFYIDPKPEKYFLPVSEIIAKDSNGSHVSVANNVGDKTRWEHNGLEYRYFSEAIYHLKSENWEASDYKTADALYFIDEGEVKEPLKFGGMEVEAFKPVKIEKMWQVETGQKIYKMVR